MPFWKGITPEQRIALLKDSLKKFLSDTSLIPVIGVEQEFFLTPNDTPPPLEELERIMQSRCAAQQLLHVSLETERGAGQYELQIEHSPQIILLAQTVEYLRDIMTEEAARFGLEAIYASKPFANQPGSSLHIHIGLCNKDGQSMMMREGEEPFREESKVMLHAIGGLLATMQESMVIFAPKEADYARFEPKFDAPTTVSWGGNNRTVALRIPASSWLLEPTRHIEHRIPSSNADPYLVIVAILEGIRHGLVNKIEPPTPKIYGDASLDMYKLEGLTGSLDGADRYYKQGYIIQKLFAN